MLCCLSLLKYLENPDDLPLVQSVEGVKEGVGKFLEEIQNEADVNTPVGMKNIKSYSKMFVALLKRLFLGNTFNTPQSPNLEKNLVILSVNLICI